MKQFPHSRSVQLILLAGMTLLLSGCASHNPTSAEPAGFLLGFFHGFTIFFSLVGSTFLEVEIYAYPNAGLVYDIGYFIGASSFLGGSGAGAKANKKAKQAATN